MQGASAMGSILRETLVLTIDLLGNYACFYISIDIAAEKSYSVCVTRTQVKQVVYESKQKLYKDLVRV